MSDNEDPVFSPASLPNIDRNNDPGQKYATVTWDVPTATDSSGQTPSVTANHEPPKQFDIGTHTVTYTARDSANNEATLSFTITVTG